MSKQFQFKLVLLGSFLDLFYLSLPDFYHRRVGCWKIEVTASQFCGSSLLTSVSSLVLRFVKDQFDDNRESTIGGPWFNE
jgi:hypothetical protein